LVLPERNEKIWFTREIDLPHSINKCMVTVPMNVKTGKRKAGILRHNDFDSIPVKMKRIKAELRNDTQKDRTACHSILSKYTNASQKVKDLTVEKQKIMSMRPL